MQPIFVLSCQRSGSTLLRYILDTHPDIASPAELNLGQLCETLYHSIYLTLGQVVASDEKERSTRVIEKVRQIVGDLMTEYTTAKGKRIWCDKSPMNFQSVGILNRVFPEARYICLHRNCMDVVHSCLDVSRNGFWPELATHVRKNPENLIAAMVDYWTEKSRKMLAFERTKQGLCFRITYEALVLDTVATLEPMFGFLGVSFDPRLLDSVFRVRHDEGPGDGRIQFSKKISKGSLGQGSRLSRTNIPPDLLEQMNSVLSELGYPVVGPDWDSAPSPYLPPENSKDQSEGVTTVQEIFDGHFTELLKSRGKRATEISAVCKVSINGEGGGNWILNFAEQSVRKDRGEVEPDCVVAVSANDLVDMVDGKLNPVAAFDRGKIRISGDAGLVTKVGMLLFGT